MNDYSRNIVILGLNKEEIGLSDIRDLKDKWDNYLYKDSRRFPYLVFVDTLEEALKHQGFMLIINGISVDDYYLFDIENRKKFKKYDIVLILSDDIYLNNISNNSLSKIKLIKRNNINDLFVYRLYKEFNLNKVTFTDNRISKLNKINAYLKNKKYIKSREIAEYFNMSLRSVERDLKDINYLYDNIGYDEKKRCWYVVD